MARGPNEVVQLYGFYDHKNGLAKVGHSHEPLNRITQHHQTAFNIELVFALPIARSLVYQAERVAHLAFSGRRRVHPAPGIAGPTEWFDVSRKSVDFLQACLTRFIDAAHESANPHSFMRAATDDLTNVAARLRRGSA